MKRKPYSITLPESLSKIPENIKKLTGQSISQQLLEAGYSKVLRITF